jgi:hypothetical protein
MKHRFQVSRLKNVLVAYTWDRMELLQDLSFVLAVVINTLILVSYGLRSETSLLGEDPTYCVAFHVLVDLLACHSKLPLGCLRTDLVS